MARMEPMDVDPIETDFEDKENSLHHSNVFPRTPCTEKGYEELDVSELNMKLRYSDTPVSSPMSRSYTGNCTYNKSDSCDSFNNTIVSNESNLTRSLNSTITKGDSLLKSLKLPLQSLSSGQFVNGDKSSSVKRSLDVESNVTITISRDDNDDNISLPSTSSSTVHTPEATTPTKDVPKSSGSPIMRGLKSVLNMFRPSQSPVAPNEDLILQKDLSPKDMQSKQGESVPTLASTPIASSKKGNNSSKRNSPLKESVIFNDDLERELQWTDETIVLFKDDKLLPKSLSMQPNADENMVLKTKEIDELNSTVENMEVSGLDAMSNDSIINDKTMIAFDDIPKPTNEMSGVESDSEFVDCETTHTKKESYILQSLETKKTSPIFIQTKKIPQESYTEEHLECLSIENIQDSIVEYQGTSSVSEINNLTQELSVDRCSNIIPALDSTFQVPDIRNLEDECNIISSATENSIAKMSTHISHPETQIDSNEFEFEKKDIIFLKQPDLNVANMSYVITQDDEVNTSIENKQDNEVITQVFNVTNLPKTVSLNDVGLLQNGAFSTISNNDSLKDTDSETKINNVNIGNSNEINNVDFNHSIPPIKEFISNHTQINPNVLKDSLDTTMYQINSNGHIEDELEIINKETEIDNNLQFKCNTNLLYTSSSSQDNDTHSPDSKMNLNNLMNQNDMLITQNQQENFDNKQVDLKIMQANTHTINNMQNETINTNIYEQEQNKIKDLSLSQLQDNIPLDIIFPNYDIDKDSTIDLCSQKKCESDVLKHQTYSLLQKPLNKPDNPEQYNDVPINLLTNLGSCIDAALVETITTKEISIKDSISIDLEDSKNEQVIIPSNICKLSSENEVFNTDTETIVDELHKPETDNSRNIKELKNDFQIEQPSSKNDITAKGIDEEILHPDNNSSNDTITDINPNDSGIKNNSAAKDLSEKSDVLNEEGTNKNNIKTTIIDEKILSSSNNSPHCSMTDINHLPEERIDISLNIKNEKRVSPKISPKVLRKGYNINFDDIGDPFATKTNIRISPPREILLETSNVLGHQKKQNNTVVHKKLQNRKMSQVSSKKSETSKCPNRSSSEKENKEATIKPIEEIDISLQSNCTEKYLLKNNIHNEIINENIQQCLSEDKEIGPISLQSDGICSQNMDETHTKSNENTIKYLNRATDNYYENTETKSVFNLPEIGDTNFKNFSKIKTVQSLPSQEMNIDKFINHDEIVSHTEQTNSTMCLEDHIHEEDKISPNISNITASSRNTDDKNITVCEVHTEDEDTIEGPFFDIDEVVDVAKVSDIETENDVIQFEYLPSKTGQENIDNELFIDADAFEFLLNQNKSNVVVDSGKESLFLKFDPLFAKRVSSEDILPASNSLPSKQSTPKKLNNHLLHEEAEQQIAGLSNSKNMSDELNDETGNIISKPMMVVNPAVNPIVSPRKSATPPRVNRQSLTFTSPAMVVIDRLLSLSANTSLLDHNTSIPESNRNLDTDIALIQVRELLAEKEIEVYNLRCESKDLQERLATLELQVNNLETESHERLRKVNNLNEHLAEKVKINKCMANVVEEYERTIASLITEMEQDKKRNAEERMRLISDRDEQTSHLASMEDAYNDLHSKYEKSKQIIFSMKANEDIYKKSLKEFDENLLKMHKNYELLKQHATTKLNHANQELEKINRAHGADMIKLTTKLRRKEMDIASLEETLAHKIKANEELTAICDELINKVG